MTSLRIQAALQQQQILHQALVTGLKVVIDCSYASGEPSPPEPPPTLTAAPAGEVAASNASNGTFCSQRRGRVHVGGQERDMDAKADDYARGHQHSQQEEKEQQEQELQQQQQEMGHYQQGQQQQGERLQQQETQGGTAGAAKQGVSSSRSSSTGGGGADGAEGDGGGVRAPVAWGLGATLQQQEREVRSLVKQIEISMSLNRR
jgi:Tfp pilus assembly protein FimV